MNDGKNRSDYVQRLRRVHTVGIQKQWKCVDLKTHVHVLNAKFGAKKNCILNMKNFEWNQENWREAKKRRREFESAVMQNKRLIFGALSLLTGEKISIAEYDISRDAFLELQRDVASNFQVLWDVNMYKKEKAQYLPWIEAIKMLADVRLGGFRFNVLKSMPAEEEYTLFKDLCVKYDFKGNEGKLAKEIEEMQRMEYYKEIGMKVEKTEIVWCDPEKVETVEREEYIATGFAVHNAVEEEKAWIDHLTWVKEESAMFGDGSDELEWPID